MDLLELLIKVLDNPSRDLVISYDKENNLIKTKLREFGAEPHLRQDLYVPIEFSVRHLKGGIPITDIVEEALLKSDRMLQFKRSQLKG